MQPSCADVLGAFVDPPSQFRDALQAPFVEADGKAFGFHQRFILLSERSGRLHEDALEVTGGQRRQLHPDGQAALELGDQVRRLGQVECAGGDEQNVIGAHHAVAGGDGAALDQGQQIPLHPLPGYVGPQGFGAPRYLVDLVEKHDAGLLDGSDGLRFHLVLVDELGRLLLAEPPVGILDLQSHAAGALGAQVAEHAL